LEKGIGEIRWRVKLIGFPFLNGNSMGIDGANYVHASWIGGCVFSVAAAGGIVMGIAGTRFKLIVTVNAWM